jgi:hypothetical protein
MATPHVDGGGALYLSTHPTATPLEVEMAVRAAALATGTMSKDARPITREVVASF